MSRRQFSSRKPCFVADLIRRQAPHTGDRPFQNDQELKVTRERIAYLLDVLARLRVSSRPEEMALVGREEG